jgi:hypothetical protein
MGVESKEGELTVAPGLLAQLELEGHLITGDARYAQRGLSGQVVDPRQVGVVSTSG